MGLEDRILIKEKVHHIEDYLQAADFCLFTSETESFCLSILEAMCFACPSVATRVGGIPEVVEEDISGLLVNSLDVLQLAGAVERMIQNIALRADLGRAAKQRAQKFSADQIVPQYETLYRRVLESDRGAQESRK